MKASYICSEIYKWIQEKEEDGVIHSIFKNTINIESQDGRFISIVVKGKPMSPNSMVLEEILDFNDLNIKIGERCVFAKDSLTCGDTRIFYKNPKLWNRNIKLIESIDTYENFQFKLRIIKEFILAKGNKDGIYGLMKYIPGDLFSFHKTILEDQVLEDKSQLFIKDRFISFINAFIAHDLNRINVLSKKIIGFGPGLTPSMDDFLSGMMIANIYVSYFLSLNLENAYLLNHEIVKDIENMTTRVSEEMLKLSSLGQANEDIRNLMTALIGIDKENKGLDRLLTKVISFGHSSGTDILCGIYVASFILAKYKII